MKTEECWWCGENIEPGQEIKGTIETKQGKEEQLFCDEDCIEEARVAWSKRQENGA